MNTPIIRRSAPIFCGCGCLGITTGARFLPGHNSKLRDPDNPSKPKPGFQPGHKHATGRKQGSRNNATLATVNMIEGERDAITRKCIDLALAGSVPMLKCVLERLVPVAKHPKVNLSLPSIDSLDDIPKVTKVILANVCSGHLSIEDGSKLSSVVADLTKHFLNVNLSNDVREVKQSLKLS